MTLDEAKLALMVHVGAVLDSQKIGFVGRLRPYIGLDEADFAEIVEALVTLHQVEFTALQVDKSIAAALLDICWRSRVLVLRDGSGVRMNRLAEQDEIDRLAAWVDIIECIASRVFWQLDLAICVSPLLSYILSDQCVDTRNFGRFKELASSCINYDDQDVSEMARAVWIRLNEE